MTNKKDAIPQTAIILGYGGATPFVTLAVLSILFEERFFIEALIVYAAVIISFLGGIYWGAAMNSLSQNKFTAILKTNLCISVTPALLAWGTLLIKNVKVATILLSVGFLAQLIVDVIATKNGYFPYWYKALRIPLTAIVLLCLIVAYIFHGPL
jgi:hypothetical protein